jgi:hypothetical protein
MARFDLGSHVVVGPGGLLDVPENDEITRKLLMLIEGECEGAGPLEAARKFGYSKQRYFQLRVAYGEGGAPALQSRKRGPKTHYRRTAEAVRQVIRHRFLDGEASAEVIAQKLCQCGWKISIRSVERIIADYGLQKKTPQMPSASGNAVRGRKSQPEEGATGRRRSAGHRTRRSAAARR